MTMTTYAFYDLIDVLVHGIKNDPSLTSDLKDICSWVLYELNCLDLYISCCEKWSNSPFGAENRKFGFSVRSQMEEALVHTISKRRLSEQDLFELVEKIHLCEPDIVRDCLYFLDTSFMCQIFVGGFQDLWFYTSASLDNLFFFKAHMFPDTKPKIQSLRDNLDFYKAFSEFTGNRCGSTEDCRDVKILVEDSAVRTLCVSLLCWVMNSETKETLSPRLDVVLSDLQKKTSPSTPKVTRMYLAALEATKTSGDSITGGKLVMKFVELLKKNLQVNPEKLGIQMLFTDLIFLITFLMDKEVARNFAADNVILTEANVFINEVGSLIGLFSSDDIKEGTSEQRNFLLQTFLEKSNTLKAKVRKLCAHSFPDSSYCNFPRVNVMGVIDSLLLKLKKLHSCFPKHQIMILQEGILSLKESNLEHLCGLELQNKHKDLENLWTQIVNVAYNAERAICSFVFLKDCLWHNILCLSDAIEEMKIIKEEMKRIQDQGKCGVDTFNYEKSLNHLLPLQGNVSTNVVVGFKNEENEIHCQLTSGSEKLHVITVFGMPGSGKTTLAKKIFCDTSVQLHFHKCAWCTVSQTFQQKRILLDILSDLVDPDDRNLSDLGEEDLAVAVYRSLKGRRYLIVMDDIWDVEAWNLLKMSFPDDNMGSRIIFTTRIQNLIPEVELLGNRQFSPFHLNPLSEEESWELLEKKLFDQEKCLPDFVDIGKQIARNCKGLPLYIVIIAGLLKEKIEDLDWWNQVGKSLVDLLITKEGCKDVLELSYKHLPEFLKPCFLYFGLFQEDEVIKVKKLIWLWIAEGFIQRQDLKSLEIVAEEYLMDLVARSLVIVTRTTCRGGIKTCVVHDLLREFCIMKGAEEKLVKLVSQGKQDRDLATTHARYRVHIESRSWESFIEHPDFVSSLHSLFYPGRYKFSGEHVQSLPFSYFKFLHVLDINLSLSEFPETLVLLRYLAFDYASMNIPPSIKGLQNLETLCVYRTVHALPTTLWELKKLRHVSGLVQIPTDFCASDVAPLEIVQTFSARVYYKDAEMFFRTIPTIGKLKCKFLFSDDQSPHQVIKLDNLTRLESLHMDNYDCASAGLYSCTFCFPSTLQELSLSGFQLPWSEISPIAELQNLEILKLEDCFRGRSWYVGDDDFPSLKCLILRDLYIEELNASYDSFPRLERLVIERCYKFKEIPSRFGSILTLKMIQVKDCPYSLNNSVRKIQEELTDLGNEDLKVLIVERKPHTYAPSHFKSFNHLECATYDP